MAKALWFIIWLIILLIFSFWIAGFIAFFYIILYPVTVCIPDLSVGFNLVSTLLVFQLSLLLSTGCHRFPSKVHSVPENLRGEHDVSSCLEWSDSETEGIPRLEGLLGLRDF
jgi:hypothetical protein